jgi:hypothetical protein
MMDIAIDIRVVALLLVLVIAATVIICSWRR